MAKKKIRIIEVGLRDGLQNQDKIIPLDTRLMMAEKLVHSGVQHIEIGAFVSPKWVPQMQGSADLLKMAQKKFAKALSQNKLTLPVLVPNERGMFDAVEAKATEVAFFTAVSESFTKKNINSSVQQSLQRLESILLIAKKHKIKVRAYLSTCFGCPYEGKVSEAKVVSITKQLIQLGAYEVSIGDTIGVATPPQVHSLLKKILKQIPAKKIALHFHDTRGLALANVVAGLEHGIQTFDSSIAGLGGCPYAPGASGNVATENLVYLLERMGYDTGIAIDELIQASRWMSEQMQQPPRSHLALTSPWFP